MVDDSPIFLMQGWNWLGSLLRLGTVERADIYLHHVDNIDPARLRTFEKLGARLVPIKPFGEGGARYCNKVRQLETPALQDYDHVILTDADVVFAACPTRYATGTAVRAKQVDRANPPEEVWTALLVEAGLADRAVRVPLELHPDEQTFDTNFNGGFYVIPAAAWARLRTGWNEWASFCLDRAALLGDYAHHADQLGFGLAVLDAGLAVEPLGLEANFPLHLRSLHAELAPLELVGIHYHRELDSHGLLKAGPVPWIAQQVRAVNQGLAEFRRARLDNSIFWDFRYATDPILGSGVGSRGETLIEKRALLLPYFRAFADAQVLDVGCGDLETTRYMPARDYHGIDLSATAVEIARSKRPDWRFDVGRVSSLPDRAYDLSVCLDVLLHQSDPDETRSLVADLVRVARQAVIVSGYSRPIDQTGIVFYAEPLEEILAAQPDVEQVVRIGGYRDVDLFVAVKGAGVAPNRHDISIPALAYGAMQTPDWPLLNDLVALSRERLGFYPSTIIRTIEYPWFARRLERHAGERVLDVGAGVSVLPLWLAQQGCQVTTVDPHTLVRDPDHPKNTWNEWGFIDYAKLDPRITALQVDASTYTAGEPFEAIYSVSVLEHLPADLRRTIFANLRRQLGDRGRLYLSFDLIPGSDALWLFSEGKQVEDDEIHGTLDSVVGELQALGFLITELTTVRHISDSRTDIVMLEARLRDTD
ncbi:class I SAM-dependent methyltransferase [Nocardioides immobilis]|uniref:Class I SAM-dependent methyltransferase n=1 Tax=Nocardioides immobilis TaxID=2049295 RepID=A0A417Y5W1_9ACTN|nr:class I SAM-dependent methyltransferase [Nocardioides immobilis]